MTTHISTRRFDAADPADRRYWVLVEERRWRWWGLFWESGWYLAHACDDHEEAQAAARHVFNPARSGYYKGARVAVVLEYRDVFTDRRAVRT